jgi:DNA-binding transcriptional LysR family regulator
MNNLRRLFPSPSNLIVFEAAGRLGSFTAAGRELGMTQAAVSYAMRGLEDQLGVNLFRRAHRRVVLTENGKRFFADVALGLSHIQKTAQDIRAQAAGETVTLSVSTAFASFWMLPRLQEFRNDLPEIDLRIQTSDRDIDIAGEELSLGIRGGRPSDWPEYDCAELARERIFPVASAAFANQSGTGIAPTELAGHKLIHLEEPYRAAADWATWFKSADAGLTVANRGLAINDYVLVIQAVLEGQGIALGWEHLVSRLVSGGVLVRLSDHYMETGAAFFVVWPKNQNLSTDARKVRDWLLGHAEPSEGPIRRDKDSKGVLGYPFSQQGLQGR